MAALGWLLNLGYAGTAAVDGTWTTITEASPSWSVVSEGSEIWSVVTEGNESWTQS